MGGRGLGFGPGGFLFGVADPVPCVGREEIFACFGDGGGGGHFMAAPFSVKGEEWLCIYHLRGVCVNHFS